MPYTINPKDPRGLLCVLGEASNEFDNEHAPYSKALIDELRDQLREQMKPADPIEALVQEFANRNWEYEPEDGTGTRWKYFITPSRLREFAAEVLRVGIGEPDAENIVHQVLNTAGAQIQALQSVAITAERKDAYESALRVIRELRS